jgi:hypothetical protein
LRAGYLEVKCRFFISSCNGFRCLSRLTTTSNSWLKLYQELCALHTVAWLADYHGHPSKPVVNLLPPSMSVAAAFSSSTSQLAHANRPFKNLASLLAAQTMKEAGRLAFTGDVSIIFVHSWVTNRLTIVKRKINSCLHGFCSHTSLDNTRLDVQHEHLGILMV